MSSRVLLPLSMAVWLASAVPSAAQVQLAISGGRVSLTATNATLRQILAEWERVGQTRIVNGDRVGGEPLTLQLVDVPEEQALTVLLRSLSGYVAAPRASAIAGASRFDRIMVMPTTTRPRATIASQPPVAQPVSEPMTLDPADASFENSDSERPVRVVPAPNQRGAVFSAFPPPQYAPQQGTPAATPPPAPANSLRPTVPAGVAVPGMVAPAPSEPDQQDPAREPPSF